MAQYLVDLGGQSLEKVDDRFQLVMRRNNLVSDIFVLTEAFGGRVGHIVRRVVERGLKRKFRWWAAFDYLVDFPLLLTGLSVDPTEEFFPFSVATGALRANVIGPVRVVLRLGDLGLSFVLAEWAKCAGHFFFFVCCCFTLTLCVIRKFFLFYFQKNLNHLSLEFYMASNLSGLPSVLACAGGASGMVYFDPLNMASLAFVPTPLLKGLEASLGVLGVSLVLDFVPTLGSLSMLQKERFMLSTFLSTTVASFVGGAGIPYFGLPQNQTELLAAAAGVIVSAFLPENIHIIKSA